MRRSTEPQHIVLVLFRILTIAVLLSPLLVGAILPMSLPQYLLVGVLMPINFFALDYWRTVPNARLDPRWTVALSAAAVAIAAYVVANGGNWLATSLLSRGAVFGLLALVPVMLIRDSLNRWHTWRPDA